jgi:hypothetical protein
MLELKTIESPKFEFKLDNTVHSFDPMEIILQFARYEIDKAENGLTLEQVEKLKLVFGLPNTTISIILAIVEEFSNFIESTQKKTNGVVTSQHVTEVQP